MVCLSSVLHHMSGENWEAAAACDLGRWAYPESKLAMVRLAKVQVKIKKEVLLFVEASVGDTGVKLHF